MTRGKGTKTQEILSASERESILDEKRDLVDSLKEAGQYGKGTAGESIDQAKIHKQIERLDKAVLDREPPKLRGAQKDEMAKEADAIEAELREGMPTREEMRFPGRNPGAVRKHMGWSSRNSAKIERYRYIQRVINPDEPRSVENLRREK